MPALPFAGSHQPILASTEGKRFAPFVPAEPIVISLADRKVITQPPQTEACGTTSTCLPCAVHPQYIKDLEKTIPKEDEEIRMFMLRISQGKKVANLLL